MYILRIEHDTGGFDNWKRAFDSDPAGRKSMGVRRYRVMRRADNPNHVSIDLEFDTSAAAGALLDALHGIWKSLDPAIISNPRTSIEELVETKDL